MEPNIVLGVVFCIFSLVALSFLILSIWKGEPWDTFTSMILTAVMAISIIIAVCSFTSHRYPIVRATIDDAVSFKEVYESYELIDVEGDIYTFKVKGE